jgi:hypothetical protein
MLLCTIAYIALADHQPRQVIVTSNKHNDNQIPLLTKQVASAAAISAVTSAPTPSWCCAATHTSMPGTMLRAALSSWAELMRTPACTSRLAHESGNPGSRIKLSGVRGVKISVSLAAAAAAAALFAGTWHSSQATACFYRGSADCYPPVESIVRSSSPAVLS